MNSDPLFNIDFLSEANMRTKEQSSVDDKPQIRISAITRTTSETGIDEIKLKRRGVMLEKVISEDDIFSDKSDSANKVIPDTKETSRTIFSDSEGVDVKSVNSPKKSSKGKGPAHTHKRSRSDISGIKKTLTPTIADQSSDSTPLNTDATASISLGRCVARKNS